MQDERVLHRLKDYGLSGGVSEQTFWQTQAWLLIPCNYRVMHLTAPEQSRHALVWFSQWALSIAHQGVPPQKNSLECSLAAWTRLKLGIRHCMETYLSGEPSHAQQGRRARGAER